MRLVASIRLYRDGDVTYQLAITGLWWYIFTSPILLVTSSQPNFTDTFLSQLRRNYQRHHLLLSSCPSAVLSTSYIPSNQLSVIAYTPITCDFRHELSHNLFKTVENWTAMGSTLFEEQERFHGVERDKRKCNRL